VTIKLEQGKGGKDRNVIATPARPAANLVEGGAAAGLAVPRPRSGAADDHAPAQSCLSRRRPDGGDQQARLAAYLAAQLRHSPAHRTAAVGMQWLFEPKSPVSVSPKREFSRKWSETFGN
jgi:hypothetical protein